MLFLSLLLITSLNHSQASESRASYFIEAWNRLPSYMNSCLKSSNCDLNQSQHDLLTKIANNYKSEIGLFFTDETENPGLFSKVGPHRIAVTANDVGDTVYINRDELHNFDYTAAISILVHELGHHHGVKDTTERALDILGTKVQRHVLAQSETIDLSTYNQPQLSMMIFSSGDLEWLKANGSEILIFDDFSAYALDQNLFDSVPCPLGMQREGGLIASQLIQSGLTDWSPKRKQGAIFEFNLREICSNSQETIALWLRVRNSSSIDILSPYEKSHDWWKRHRGYFGEESLNIISEAGVNFDFYDNFHVGMPLKIQSFEVNKELKDGETLRSHFKVSVPFNSHVPNCRSFISSSDFVSTMQLTRYKFPSDTCRIKSLGSNSYELEISHVFPSPTPSRQYFIESIQIFDDNETTKFIGYPDRSEASFYLNSRHPSQPIQILPANLIYQEGATGPTAPYVIIDQEMDLYGGKAFSVPTKSLFALTMFFDSQSSFKPASALIGNYDWSLNEHSRRHDNFMIPFIDSSANWHFPWNGGTTIMQNPQSPNMLAFQLSLRPYTVAKDPPAINILHKVNYHTLWLTNENLQELVEDLDFSITTY